MQKRFLGCLIMAWMGVHASLVADQIWQTGAGSATDWFNTNNWSGGAVPTSVDLALFQGPGNVTPTISSAVGTASVLGIQYTGGTSYTILFQNSAGSIFTIGASGIDNQSGILQTLRMQPSLVSLTMEVNGSVTGENVLFVLPLTGGGPAMTLRFHGTASTGTSTFSVNGAGPGGATVNFLNNTTAASSTFNSNSTLTIFNNNSTAGNAVFNLTRVGGGLSQLVFTDNSSAQNAVINASSTIMTFAGAATGGSAAVSLSNPLSSLTLNSGNNTLGSLSTDSNSSVSLNANNLQVGSLGTSTTIAGPVTGGGGSLTKVGAGILTLSGVGKVYTGPTTVNGGTLLLNTSIAGDAIVNSGATLAGTGTVGGNGTINSGGTISPGNSIGTITVNGNYTQNAGSVYLVEIAGSNQTDLIQVNGTATLNGGTVQVSGTPVIGGVYDILHANGGVTGTFSSLIVNSPFRVGLVYQPLDVLLEILGTNFTPFAGTPNQRHVAQQLDSITTLTPDEILVVNALGQLTIPQFQHALDLMSGEQYANLLPIEQQVTRRFVRRLYDPLRELLTGCLCCTPCRCDEYGIQPWLQVEGGRSFLRKDFNGRGFKDDYYSISYGAQTMLEMLDACWVVGVAGDYSHDRIRHNLSGHSKLRTSEAALYGAVFRPDFYVLADLVGGQTSCSLRRHIQFGDINRRTRAHPDLWNILGYAELGYNFCTNHVLLQPFVAFENGYYLRKRVRERGANSLDLIIKKETVTSFDSRMGFHFTSCFCDQYILSADIAWQHRFNSLGDNLRNQFIDFGDTFSIRGPRQGRDGIDAAIYLGAQVREWLTLFAEFNGEKWNRYSTWGALGGLESRF